METTFISIHDLEDDARILYSSDSIIDILGYTPDEVVNRSAWEFFSEDELPYARKFHQKRVLSDKAAVLAYCRVKDKNGRWIGCECCFTIVYDVMVVCTSIYRRGGSSQKRATEAPVVRRIFSSSPRDPRYHMLSHISAKFAQSAKAQEHEPRAALFLNRFTRTLTVMYATTGIQDIIGIPAEVMRGRSFYYCIAENCLQDAIKCLENAKGNDSIAYLRFWFRDPRQDDHPEPHDDSDEEMTTDASMSEAGTDMTSRSALSPRSDSPTTGRRTSSMDIDDESKPNSRNSSNDSTAPTETHEAIFGQRLTAESSASSAAASPERDRSTLADPVELEAVISCASDGLVVCMRKARPMIPHPMHRPAKPVYENGLFAAPWATEPFLPPIDQRPGAGFSSGFAPSLGPRGAQHANGNLTARATTAADQSDFMAAIRDQAVFAWGLTGINGSLADFGQGKPLGESMPQDGLPVWASDPKRPVNGEHTGPNTNTNGTFGTHSPDQKRSSAHIFGDPGLDRSRSNGTRSASSGNGSNGNGTPYSGPR